MSTQPQSLRDVHLIVTTQFVEQLEKGIIPWHVAWNEHPQAFNGHPFDHINVWLLAHLPYPRKVFMTPRQVNRFKVSKKRGEHGHTIIGIRHGRAMPTVYSTEVLNIEQVERLNEDDVPTRIIVRNPAERCTDIVMQMPKMPLIMYEGTEVYYNLKKDIIYLPKLQSFKNGLQYHSALFYALALCTGHRIRRNRDTCIFRQANDPKTYSYEELIVEMVASYLCSYCGIEPWYLTTYHADSKGWLRRFGIDITAAITAAMYAQEAVNYILNRSYLANPIQTGVYTPIGK